MAVTKCPECGGKISTSVKQCIHCGCEIRVCPECGMMHKSAVDICEECGYSFATGESGVSVSSISENEYEKEVKDTVEPPRSNADTEDDVPYAWTIIERWEKEVGRPASYYVATVFKWIGVALSALFGLVAFIAGIVFVINIRNTQELLVLFLFCFSVLCAFGIALISICDNVADNIEKNAFLSWSVKNNIDLVPIVEKSYLCSNIEDIKGAIRDRYIVLSAATYDKSNKMTDALETIKDIFDTLCDLPACVFFIYNLEDMVNYLLDMDIPSLLSLFDYKGFYLLIFTIVVKIIVKIIEKVLKNNKNKKRREWAKENLSEQAFAGFLNSL